VDPALVAVAGALSTVSALLFRVLMKRIEQQDAEIVFWRDRYLASVALAEMATTEAEKVQP
jgi:hypothetical protein